MTIIGKRGSPVGLVDILVQQEARLRTEMCGRRRGVQE